MYFSSPLEYKGTADSTGTICLVCMVEQRKGGWGRREEENWYNPAPKTLETELCWHLMVQVQVSGWLRYCSCRFVDTATSYSSHFKERRSFCVDTHSGLIGLYSSRIGQIPNSAQKVAVPSATGCLGTCSCRRASCPCPSPSTQQPTPAHCIMLPIFFKYGWGNTFLDWVVLGERQ